MTNEEGAAYYNETMPIPNRICGRYAIGSWPAFCIEQDGIVRVHYENGCYTAADVKTFRAWGAQPISAH